MAVVEGAKFTAVTRAPSDLGRAGGMQHATAALAEGGEVIGVIPQSLVENITGSSRVIR